MVANIYEFVRSHPYVFVQYAHALLTIIGLGVNIHAFFFPKNHVSV